MNQGTSGGPKKPENSSTFGDFNLARKRLETELGSEEYDRIFTLGCTTSEFRNGYRLDFTLDGYKFMIFVPHEEGESISFFKEKEGSYKEVLTLPTLRKICKDQDTRSKVDFLVEIKNLSQLLEISEEKLYSYYEYFSDFGEDMSHLHDPSISALLRFIPSVNLGVLFFWSHKLTPEEFLRLSQNKDFVTYMLSKSADTIMIDLHGIKTPHELEEKAGLLLGNNSRDRLFGRSSYLSAQELCHLGLLYNQDVLGRTNTSNDPTRSLYAQSILPTGIASQENRIRVGKILAPYIPLSQLIDMGFEMLNQATPDIHWGASIQESLAGENIRKLLRYIHIFLSQRIVYQDSRELYEDIFHDTRKKVRDKQEINMIPWDDLTQAEIQDFAEVLYFFREYIAFYVQNSDQSSDQIRDIEILGKRLSARQLAGELKLLKLDAFGEEQQNIFDEEAGINHAHLDTIREIDKLLEKKYNFH